MSFSFYKPLLAPKPRRRDRRGARRTERLHEAMLWPDRSGQSTRELASKRAAYARHQARYVPVERSRVILVLFLGVGVVLALLVWREFVQSRHLVPLSENREAYERLVRHIASSCRQGVCSVGSYAGTRPSRDMGGLMADVQARRVRHDPLEATTWIHGAYRGGAALVYEAQDATAQQALRRTQRVHRDSLALQRAGASSRWGLREWTPLGDGWSRVRWLRR